MKRTMTIAMAVGAALALSGCIAGSAASHQAAGGGFLYQLLLGLWHGVIAPVTLIIEIINRFAPSLLPWRAHLYEARGTGVAYDIGFYLGLTGGPITVWSRWGRRA